MLSFLDINRKKRIANTMSLQVRCSPLLRKINRCVPGKRVLPFASRKNYKASMTVEAAIVLPLFVYASMALLLPMEMLDEQRRMQMKLEMSCENLSMYAYAESDLLNEEGEIVLDAVCYEKMPFFGGLLDGISLEAAAKRRGWIGYPGKLTAENTADAEDMRVEMVYVGKEMGRYHRDRNCHYISNAYQAVSLRDAKEMKDADGRRFSACASCGNEIAESGTVYITTGGRHYHGNMECRSMISYVRKVPLEEVEHLGACSYCGKQG